MRVGSLVRTTHTGEMWVITYVRTDEYVEINGKWLVPKEHLEVLCE